MWRRTEGMARKEAGRPIKKLVQGRNDGGLVGRDSNRNWSYE